MRTILWIGVVALATAAAPRASAFELGSGDRVGYDVSLALRWRVDEIFDPLALEAKLTLERPAKPDAALGEALLGRLDFRRAVYAGPTRRWRLERGTGLPHKARLIAADFSPAATGPGYAGRLAAMEELLGMAAAAAHGRRFRATIANDGNVTVTFDDREAIERAIPDPSGRAALDAWVGQALRFVLEDIRPEPPAPVVPGAADEPGAPYTLEAALGARYDRKLDLAAIEQRRRLAETGASAARTTLRAPESIDLRVDDYRTRSRGQASVARGNGLVLRRKLEVEETVRGRGARTRDVNVTALVRWQAELREAKLARERAVATRSALGLAP